MSTHNLHCDDDLFQVPALTKNFFEKAVHEYNRETAQSGGRFAFSSAGLPFQRLPDVEAALQSESNGMAVFKVQHADKAACFRLGILYTQIVCNLTPGS
jgi:hypothetical protein